MGSCKTGSLRCQRNFLGVDHLLAMHFYPVSNLFRLQPVCLLDRTYDLQDDTPHSIQDWKVKEKVLRFFYMHVSY